MNIFMRHVSVSATEQDVTREIAHVLHTAEYVPFASFPLNFNVELYPDSRGTRLHGGIGALTLPHVDAAKHFLQTYGGRFPQGEIYVNQKRIVFEMHKSAPRRYVLNRITDRPYVDPDTAEQLEQVREACRSQQFNIRSIQFGWECRDQVFSVEWERPCFADSEDFYGIFDDDAREIRLKLFTRDETRIAAFRFSQVQQYAAGVDDTTGQSCIQFSLKTPPAYETEATASEQRDVLSDQDDGFKGSVYDLLPRSRHTAFEDGHAVNAAYTSLAIRLTCCTEDDLLTFNNLCSLLELPEPIDYMCPAEYRDLFTAHVICQYDKWVLGLPWRVAFHVEALARSLVLDLRELLGLAPAIQNLLSTKGRRYVESLIHDFRLEAKDLWATAGREQETIEQCFARFQQEFKSPANSLVFSAADDVFECLHVKVTPTSYKLSGPFPEQSNRVIRTYAAHEDSFLRVSFTDEDEIHYRFNREVHGPEFIRRRVGGTLDRLIIAGRTFEFLAYSQSALKDHAVWFVKPFRDSTHTLINAATIIDGIGSFHDLDFDRNLIYCPARYGARISQAFTATDPSISADAEEILYIPDVERDDWNFTDGVGTISRELAGEIQTALARRRRHRYPLCPPVVFQIRLMGCKGMLSVDHKLQGRAVCLRPSMIKFNAPESTIIEIVHAVDRPSRFYLNRPLIMLLEGLGVPPEVFQAYQDMAVSDTQDAAESLGRAAVLLDSHGLGVSYRLPSVLHSLHKLPIRALDSGHFRRMMDFAVYHVLRELKQRARIPVPGGWTLTGVADVHRHLRANEIFACVTCPYCRQRVYLEGPTLVTRSPVIHPGDVQIVDAIGAPAPGSPFASEPLANSLVFSVKGDRPLASFLGGGDLDGDVYNVWSSSSRCLCNIPKNVREMSLLPENVYEPASYRAAPRVLLEHPSTMADVGEFFMDYITSDVLGLIATNWLVIADQSPDGILDDDCFTLAQLHSDAVDYPKSGRPVPITAIPRLHRKAKPDWCAPESARHTACFYESQRAVGKLFRAIELPVLDPDQEEGSQAGSEEPEDDLDPAADGLHNLFRRSPQSLSANATIARRLARRISGLGVQVEALQPAAMEELFRTYARDLHAVCAAHALAPSGKGMLSEEEVLIGTIIAKGANVRRRKTETSRMREHATALAGGVRHELRGEETASKELWLRRAWTAWLVSLAEKEAFGAKSFWWLALGAVFDAIKAIEATEGQGRYDYGFRF